MAHPVLPHPVDGPNRKPKNDPLTFLGASFPAFLSRVGRPGLPRFGFAAARR